MNNELHDGFNRLDVAMTECIQAGMTVAAVGEVAECVLALRELRERLENALRPSDETPEAP